MAFRTAANSRPPVIGTRERASRNAAFGPWASRDAAQHIREKHPPSSPLPVPPAHRSEEHTSELQSLMRISYAVFCLKKKRTKKPDKSITNRHNNVQDIRNTNNICYIQ